MIDKVLKIIDEHIADHQTGLHNSDFRATDTSHNIVSELNIIKGKIEMIEAVPMIDSENLREKLLRDKANADYHLKNTVTKPDGFEAMGYELQIGNINLILCYIRGLELEAKNGGE